MGVYTIDGQSTNTAGTTTLSLVNAASALKRIKVRMVQLYSDVSADNAYEAVVQNCTADGTLTGVTPLPRDPADGAASGVAGENHSGEPTYTANAIMLSLGGHQRATYQWYAQPGSEIIIPKTNDVGVGLQTITAATAFNQIAMMEFEE